MYIIGNDDRNIFVTNVKNFKYILKQKSKISKMFFYSFLNVTYSKWIRPKTFFLLFIPLAFYVLNNNGTYHL